MKKEIFKSIVLSLFFAVMLSSCKSGEQNEENDDMETLAARETYEQIERDHSKEIEVFRDESYARANSNDQMIAELSTRTAGINSAERADFQARIHNLEIWNDNMKERLANYKEDDHANWEAFTTAFRQDMDALGQAIYYLSFMEAHSEELSSSKSAQEQSIH